MRSSARATRSQPRPSLSPTRVLFERRGWILGILNATPDSFFAGSRVQGPHSLLQRAAHMLRDGADGLDLGAESTRPGAAAVPPEEERRRILPALKAMQQRFPQALISIDTQKATIAAAAFDHGAHVLNDISALRADPAMAEVAAHYRCPVILMHMQGTPQTMQRRPFYRNVLDEVKRFFEERLTFAVRAGIREDRILLDPGFGFGKTFTHNMTLLRHLSHFLTFKRPLLIGLSRKRFIGQLLGGGHDPLPVDARGEGSVAAGLYALQQGAAGLRVHDVQATKRALTVWQALAQGAAA